MSRRHRRDLGQGPKGKNTSSHTLRRRSTAAAFITALLLSLAAPAFADAPPPTNGGNGTGQSQCTGNPDDRPASCGP
jgi:hypothetical protein